MDHGWLGAMQGLSGAFRIYESEQCILSFLGLSSLHLLNQLSWYWYRRVWLSISWCMALYPKHLPGYHYAQVCAFLTFPEMHAAGMCSLKLHEYLRLFFRHIEEMTKGNIAYRRCGPPPYRLKACRQCWDL